MKTRGFLFSFILIVGGGVYSFLSFSFCSHFSPSCYRIGILKTTAHPALDTTQKIIMEILEKECGKKIVFEEVNAEGLLSKATILAKNFHENAKLHLIVTLGSPATNVMAHFEKRKPIVFAAVSEMESLNLSQENQNITGCLDSIDILYGVNLVQTLFPRCRSVGLLYDREEIASSHLVRKLQRAFLEKGVSCPLIPLQVEGGLGGSLFKVDEEIDLIFLPSDNTIASKIGQIVTEANEKKIPLFALDHLLVESGVLAASGVDYVECGRMAAMMALQVLEGSLTVSEIPVQQAPPAKIFIYQPGVENYEMSLLAADLEHVVFIAESEKGQ